MPTEDEGQSRGAPAPPPGLERVLLADHTVDELLELVVSSARAALQGADSVSVTLVREARPTTSNWTDDVSRELDAVQYRSGDGPCLDAIRREEQVSLSLALEPDRYPAFGAAAVQRFITSVLSTPLRMRDRTTGALNVYSGSVESFDPSEADAAAHFAEQASVLLANAVSYAGSTALNTQLEEALASRDLIGQAKGILMERYGCTADEAFDMLRQSSQRSNRKLTVIAGEVVSATQP